MNTQIKQHIEATLDKGMRLDGRKPEEYREVKVETGVTRNAEGSAKVTIGETEVIVGVKLAIEKPYPDTPEDGTMMINVELLALSNPEFEPGPPSIRAIEMARVVDRGIRESEMIDTKALCVEKGEKAWSVLIDVCPVNDAGNLLDAASLGALAAVKECKFPAYDGTEIDYKTRTDKGLPLSEEPIEATVYRVGKHFIVDPTIDEEEVYDSRLTVAVTADERICALQKGGAQPMSVEEIDKMITIAKSAVKRLREKVRA
jgi:exosome complex component RRP42